jgi:chromosome partitioning protein
MSHALIAYAPEDLDHLLRIHEALRLAGVPDHYEKAAGDDGPSTVDDSTLDGAFCLIVPVTAAAQRSERVRMLIERAVNKGLTIFPVRMDKSRLAGFFRKEIGPKLVHDGIEEPGLGEFVAAVLARYRRRCPVVAVMNLKGGVGKTTVSAQVFGTLQAETRGRVLLIDFDPQYNLTQHFYTMADADRLAAADRSVISLFERSRLHYADAASPAESWSEINEDPFDPAPRRKISNALLPTDMPGWMDLVAGQFEISKYAFAPRPEALLSLARNFRRAIDQFRSAYDLIVFDTNPNATFLTTCALRAADRVLAPMHADEFSLRGVKLLNSLIQSQMGGEQAPPEVSVLFNAVARNEQSDFEADARNGEFDTRVGFPLSKALMQAAIPRSNFLRVQQTPDAETEPHKRLLIHSGRGGGLKTIRERLRAVVIELQKDLDAGATARKMAA